MTGRIRFGVFEADMASGELYREGRLVPLQQQPFEVLRALVEQPGEVVTREALRKRLWPEGVVVDFDQSLNKSLTKLRDALGDRAANPRFIQTLPKRGYRFITPVTPVAPWPVVVAPSDEPAPAVGPRAGRSYLRRLAIGVVTAGIAASVALVWRWETAPPTSRPVTTPSAREQKAPFTPIPAARDAYERGRLALVRGSESSLRQSVALFTRAKAFSPKYADAHAALAVALSTLASERPSEAERIWSRVRAAATAALTIDPSSSAAHAALGRVAHANDRNWAAAESHFRRAIALESSNALARSWYAVALADVDRHQEAESEARRALAADPHALVTNMAMGAVLYRARRFDECAAAVERVIEIDPEYPPARRLLVQLRERGTTRPLVASSRD